MNKSIPLERGHLEVIAHRGASGSVLENTIQAFEKAVEAGSDWIELDVRLLKDGTLAVFHDASLMRLAGRPDRIESMTGKHLPDVSIGRGMKIPTLEEVFKRFAGRIPLIVEAKTRYRGRGRRLPERLLEVIHRHDVADRVLVSSFHVPLLAELRDRSPEIRLGLLVHRESPALITRMGMELAVHSIHAHRSAVKRAWVSRVQARGLKVYVYTVNKEKEMRHFKELGVDGLFTNFPERLKCLSNSGIAS